MLQTVARRLILLPITLLLVSFVTFIVLRATGNPITIFLDVNHTPEQVAALTQRLHLDQPLVVQYFIYLGDLLRGDFGQSLQFGGPAINPVLQSLGPTLQLMGCALALAVVFGIIGGMAAAVYRDRVPDALLSSLAVIGQSMPSFWLGILLIQLFALKLQWLPTSGSGDWQQLVLPSLTLAAFLLPNFLLVTRTAVIELLDEQFVSTARAKGLSRLRILLTHIFPNALNPILSFLGIQVGTLVGGSVITESIFGWPGLGRLMIGAVSNRDVPVVLAAVVLTSIAIVFANLIVDVLQSLIDPRIRQD
ncbi:MAG TPA: ABC transporter permease [Devosiaceae bacterium]|jgi:peptide/nickel transport system permease protein/glutathione transport system permease protein